MAEKASTSRSLSRRSFLKTTAAAAGVAAVAGTAGVAAYAAGGPEEAAQNKEVIGSCRSNCGGKCPLKVKVRNGKVVKTEPADMPEGDELYRRICVKGLSQPQRLYDPDRLKYPMRRIEGTERGTEEFERISWDEALDLVAQQLKKTYSEHGPRAVYMPCNISGGRKNVGAFAQCPWWIPDRVGLHLVRVLHA